MVLGKQSPRRRAVSMWGPGLSCSAEQMSKRKFQKKIRILNDRTPAFKEFLSKVKISKKNWERSLVTVDQSPLLFLV
jgi:hypothetical protein